MEKISVLIVDDKPQNLLALEDQLEEFALQIVKASSGEEALKLSVRQEFALIMLDVQMPGMDGFETAEILRSVKKTAEIPIIFISAINQNEAIMFKGYQSGAVDFLFKPVDSFVLKSKVNIFIQLYQQRKKLETINEQLGEKVKERTQELENLNKTFRLFVPKQFVERIESTETDFLQAGYFHEEDFTILFSDIRSYTNLSEKMTPQESFDFLNDYLQQMEPSIANHGGFVDKFIGDGIMALFDQKNGAERAIEAAIAMHQQWQDYNKDRENQGKSPIEFGVGINTGPVVVGAVGSPNRLDSTVIGDHVNIASRLEQLTKKYHSKILISQHTYQEIPAEKYNIREIDMLKLKGKDNPVLVYEVLDCDPPQLIEKKSENIELYHQGMKAFHSQDFAHAADFFTKFLEAIPEDIVALDYLKRSNYLFRHPFQPEETLARINDSLDDSPYDRRKFPRIHFSTSIHVHAKGKGSLTGTILNIACWGVRVLLEGELAVQEIVTLEINAKDQNDVVVSSMKILAQVAWRKPAKQVNGSASNEMGIEFVVITSEQEAIFQNWLTEKIIA